MSADTFEQVVARVVEFRSALAGTEVSGDALTVSFCGLGEPLLHSSIAAYVGRFRSMGLPVVLSSNASLLDESRGQALVDAGLTHAFLNVGATEANYEELYGLPFATTRDNVVRFRELAANRCRISVVVIDHDGDADAASDAVGYWRSLGLTVSVWGLINRGGSLPVEHMRYRDFAEVSDANSMLRDRFPDGPACAVPQRFHFVGWNGQHYLCSSDWEKRSSHGHVSNTSFAEAAASKLRAAQSREPVCASCTHDPTNRLATAIRDGDPRSTEEIVGDIAEDVADASTLAALGVAMSTQPRRRIPVRSTDTTGVNTCTERVIGHGEQSRVSGAGTMTSTW